METRSPVPDDLQAQNAHTDAEIRKKLFWLASDYYRPDDRVQDTYTRLAVALSKTVDKTPPWTWRYPHQIERGKMSVCPGIHAAVVKLYKHRTRPRKPYPPHIRVTYPPDVDPEYLARHQSLTMTQRRAALDHYIKAVLNWIPPKRPETSD